MEPAQQFPMNDIRINDEVTKAIVGRASLEVPGVSSLCGGNIYQSLVKWGSQSETKGVAIEKSEDGGTIERVEVHVTVESGYPIPSVARNLQSKVKETVEAMTGKEVGEIYVYIDDLREKPLNAQEKKNGEELSSQA